MSFKLSIQIIKVFLFILLFFSISNVHAARLEDALEDFRAKLFAYFKNQPDPILPIFLPSGEIPGDIYRDAFGGYFARQQDCFDGLRVDEAPTRLLHVLDAKSSKVSGKLRGQLTKAAKAGGEAGFEFDENIEIRFEDLIIRVSPDIQLKKAFRSKEPQCAPIAKLMDKPGEGNTKLILGQVLIGKQIIETKVSVSLSGQAAGRLDADPIKKKLNILFKALEKKGLSLKASGELHLSGSRKAYTKLSLTDERLLPIGYRPAFVSQRHLQKILTYVEKGILTEIENEVIKTRNARSVAEKYKEVIIPTKRLLVEMGSGELVPLDLKNPEHIKYLKGLGLLFGIRTEVDSQ